MRSRTTLRQHYGHTNYQGLYSKSVLHVEWRLEFMNNSLVMIGKVLLYVVIDLIYATRAYYATVGGKLATAFCWFFGTVSLLTGHSPLVSLWTICVGCLLGFWELPGLYYCIPQSDEYAEILSKRLSLDNKLIRSVMYFFMGLLCLPGQSPCIAAGLALFLSALLYGFAKINEHSDSQDGTIHIGSRFDTSTVNEKSSLTSSSGFGTF